MAGLDPAILDPLRNRPPLSRMRGGWVCLLTNRPGGTLYIGVTAGLSRRISRHRQGKGSVFTTRDRLTRLVPAEPHETIASATQREKAMKHWPPAWKIALIERDNPAWEDPCEQINA